MLQYEPITSYVGHFHLNLESKIITGSWGGFGLGYSFLLLWFVCFPLLEDPLRKLHEYCGTASPLHTVTILSRTTECAHKMIGQISYKKKSQIL